MNKVRLGIIGLGTVGAGAVNLVARNQTDWKQRRGLDVSVTCASARDLSKPRDCDLSDITLIEDPLALVESDQVDIVVELMGGDDLAKRIVERAIELGKPVVTANKALIALHGEQLFKCAVAGNVPVKFEAAVAGGIPIIKAISEGLASNQIKMVAGIIHGTGNFILSQMKEKNRSFKDALQEAQDLGYAEADPTFDVEGIDAAHKLAILASMAFGIPLRFDRIYTEGITALQSADIGYAKEFGYRIKHLGIAKKMHDGVELRVHPTLVPQKRLLAHVNGVMNAVLVKGDAVGNTLHYGAGAGAEPTASAVIADVLDLARDAQMTDGHLGSHPVWNVPSVPLGFLNDGLSDLPIKGSDEFVSAYYLRVDVRDEVGVMSKLTTAFANHGISLEGIKQKEPNEGEDGVSVILITQRCVEKDLNAVVGELSALPQIQKEIMKIRVEYLD